MEGHEAFAFYAQHPRGRGYPALIDKERVTIGPAVFLAVPLFVVSTWWTAIARLFFRH